MERTAVMGRHQYSWWRCWLHRIWVVLTGPSVDPIGRPNRLFVEEER